VEIAKNGITNLLMLNVIDSINRDIFGMQLEGRRKKERGRKRKEERKKRRRRLKL